MDAKKFFSTREAARMLGVKPNTLSRAVYDRRIPEPAKLGNSRLWVMEDIERASLALLKRPLPEVSVEKGVTL